MDSFPLRPANVLPPGAVVIYRPRNPEASDFRYAGKAAVIVRHLADEIEGYLIEFHTGIIRFAPQDDIEPASPGSDRPH